MHPEGVGEWTQHSQFGTLEAKFEFAKEMNRINFVISVCFNRDTEDCFIMALIFLKWQKELPKMQEICDDAYFPWCSIVIKLKLSVLVIQVHTRADEKRDELQFRRVLRMGYARDALLAAGIN